MPKHTHKEFITFLNAVERAVPAGKVFHDLTPVRMLLAKSLGASWLHHKAGESGLPYACEWCATQPRRKADHVHCCGSQHMLKMRFYQPDVASTTEMECVHAC